MEVNLKIEHEYKELLAKDCKIGTCWEDDHGWIFCVMSVFKKNPSFNVNCFVVLNKDYIPHESHSYNLRPITLEIHKV